LTKSVVSTFFPLLLEGYDGFIQIQISPILRKLGGWGLIVHILWCNMGPEVPLEVHI